MPDDSADAPAPAGEVTSLLAEWRDGADSALDRLLPLIYEDLRRVAAYHLGHEREAHTLEPTALAHEVYLRLIDQRRATFASRVHFLSVAARLTRRVLVDHARARDCVKRGGDVTLVPLGDLDPARPEPTVDLLALDLALQRLGQEDESKLRVVELRYFGGLTIEETAEALGSSAATVKRQWSFARAWLLREIESPGHAV